MTGGDLEYLKVWFGEYTGSFYPDGREDRKNIMVKIEHTENVCRNIVEISDRLGLNGNDRLLAETVALFHDVGRFYQYTKYKTFQDALSENHGLLGARILSEKNVLRALDADEREVVIDAVRFHNAFAIPGNAGDRKKMFLKLIRDADKVDIYRVFINYYESPVEERASATAFGLKDTPGYSEKVLACINSGKAASYQDLTSENDFRLLKLSWVYTLNFDVSLSLLRERGYIDAVSGRLPRTGEILSAIEKVNKHISERMRDGDKE